MIFFKIVKKNLMAVLIFQTAISSDFSLNFFFFFKYGILSMG